MEIVRLRGQRPDARPYSWTVVLPRPNPDGAPLRPETLNASEQMFFFGAPLAHVVQYEDTVRVARQDRTIKQITRARRAFNFGTGLDALRELPALRPELANEG